MATARVAINRCFDESKHGTTGCDITSRNCVACDKYIENKYTKFCKDRRVRHMQHLHQTKPTPYETDNIRNRNNGKYLRKYMNHINSPINVHSCMTNAQNQENEYENCDACHKYVQDSCPSSFGDYFRQVFIGYLIYTREPKYLTEIHVNGEEHGCQAYNKDGDPHCFYCGREQEWDSRESLLIGDSSGLLDVFQNMYV